MPGMNGDEATLRIHANRLIVPQPKVIMVTAYGREDVMLAAKQAEVDGFLIKPVSPSALLDTMLSVLGRGRILGRQADEPPRAQLTFAPNFAGRRLLLVEDNAINREFAIELLHSVEIEVDEAVNGEEALAMIQRQSYDGVLMDIQMPVMDGLEASRRIRGLAEKPGGERYASLPIIAMTALAMASDAEESQAAGMNDHVTKPVEPERLFSCLAKWLPPASATGLNQDGPMKSRQLADRRYSPELLQLQSLQVTEGLRRIGGEEAAYRKQLKRFREHYAHADGELQQLLQAGEWVPAENFCHSLKGVAGNLGAHALYTCIATIDELLKQQQLPGPDALAQFGDLLRQVIGDIDSLAPASKAEGCARLSRETALSKVTLLIEALTTDLGAAESLVAELSCGLAGGEFEITMNQIAAQVDVFNIDRALADLTDLQQRLAANV